MGFTQHIGGCWKKSLIVRNLVLEHYIYVLSLWYFDDLDILQHHEIQVAGKSTMEDEPEQEDKETSLVSQYAFFIVFIQTFLFTLFLLHYVI